MPGAFKNALNWVVSSSEVTGKPTVLLMAGHGGAAHAWAAPTPTLRVMGFDRVFEASLVVARRHFDDEGRLLDANLAAEVNRALAALAGAVHSRAR